MKKERGASVYITYEEYEAISSAICEIEGNMEGAEDEDYLERANKDLRALYSIMRKLRKN